MKTFSCKKFNNGGRNLFITFDHLDFEFVSHFDIRYSDFIQI
jgi:hypothetical protein